MRCIECGAEFDEMNESQPVCPGCGAVPGSRRDSADVCLLDDAAMIACTELDREEDQDAGPDLDQFFDSIRMPVDLQEAGDEAEALLQATGYATFVLPGGFRVFRLPTERVM